MRKNIEAYARYFRAKEDLAEFIQIGAAAIALLERNISVSNGASLLGSFVDACNVDHWTKRKNFNDPARKANEVSRSFCLHAIVQQVAAFDLFTHKIVSDFSRFSGWARINLPEISHEHQLVLRTPQGRWGISPCCNEIENKLGDLKDRIADLRKLLSWVPSQKLKPVIPLFDLCRMIRNRIVHGDGIIGSELQDFASSPNVKQALGHFRQSYTRADIPVLPSLLRGQRIQMQAVHAILFGAILYEIAKELNDFVCSKMNEGEFIDMAFHYGTLVDLHPFRTVKHRFPAARITHFLSGRYLVGHALTVDEVARHLAGISVEESRDKEKLSATLWSVACDRHKELSSSEKKSAHDD